MKLVINKTYFQKCYGYEVPWVLKTIFEDKVVIYNDDEDFKVVSKEIFIKNYTDDFLLLQIEQKNYAIESKKGHIEYLKTELISMENELLKLKGLL